MSASSSLKVGVDGTAVLHGRGVSRYTSNIIRALGRRSDVELSLLGYSWRQRKRLQTELEDLLPVRSARRHQVTVQPWPQSLQAKLWAKGLNPVARALPGIQVFHSWDWLQPPDQALKVVSTVHDLAIERFPETAHPEIVAHHHRAWQNLKARQAHLIAVSKTTRDDIVTLLDYPAELIHVIYEALPEEFRHVSDDLSEEDEARIRQRLEITKPYILFVGTREPRKNLDRLIQAWQPLAADFQLIVVGAAGWGEAQPIELGDYQSQLRFLNQVTDQELAVLYGEASVFAYPCLYEGFGLPILEAFHHGTPVVTANRSGMAEVAGNAAELVEPESVESIREGLEKVLNESMPDQQRRLQRMVIRLQLFDWDRVAEATVNVYRQAVLE